MKRIINFAKKFSKKIEWKRLEKKKVLIYGEFNSSILLEYIVNKDSVIVFDPGVVNFRVALKCVTGFKFSSFDYICTYIKTIKPDVIITSMDNDLYFWSFKRLFPDAVTILMQYAIHTELGDIFGILKRDKPNEVFNIDHMFLFNENVKKKYSEYIKGDAHIIGSFKSNHLQMDKYSVPDDGVITFISQYRPEQKYHPVFFFDGDTPYYRDVYYESEKALLPLIYSYCKSNKLRFQVCGHGSTAGEYHFFADLIGNYDWEFIPRINNLDSYKTTYRSKIIIGVDSALAYETYGSGKRVGLFPARFHSLQNDSFRIGWPGDLSKTGPFWSSYINKEEVDRVLNFLSKANDSEWQCVQKEYASQLMAFDKGNSALVRVLRQLDV